MFTTYLVVKVLELAVGAEVAHPTSPASCSDWKHPSDITPLKRMRFTETAFPLEIPYQETSFAQISSSSSNHLETD